MSSFAYLALEISTVVLFGLTGWHAWRRGAWAGMELLAATTYGVLLEWGNILIFGTYHYSSGFFLTVGPVPIIIGLCWAMIIYGAMAYTDQLGLPLWAAPFADALWAIVLDLAFDAVAIRLQLWTWSNPLNTGYFGVPADNFFAWLFVALAFSAYVRLVRRLSVSGWARCALLITAPIWSFIGLLLGILLYKGLVRLAYPSGAPVGGSMPIFVVTLACFATIVGGAVVRHGGRITTGIDLVPVLTRWAMHGYFLIWALLLAVAPSLRAPGIDMPALLIWVAVALLVVEGLLLVPLLQRNVGLRRQLIVDSAVQFAQQGLQSSDTTDRRQQWSREGRT